MILVLAYVGVTGKPEVASLLPGEGLPFAAAAEATDYEAALVEAEMRL